MTRGEKQSFLSRTADWGLKLVVVLSIGYYIMTQYVFYWYLEDHYETTLGVVTSKEMFSDGGDTYRYEYYVDNVKYTNSGQPRDYKKPPKIGGTYFIRYLKWMPSVAIGIY